MRGPFGEVGTRLLIMDVEAVVRGLPRLNSIVLKALGLNVPGPIGGPWMLRVLYESKGTALSVQEREIGPRTLDITRISGI